MVTLFHQLSRHWGVAARAEVFRDDDGVRSGVAQTLESYTIAPLFSLGVGRDGIFANVSHTTLRIPRLQLRGRGAGEPLEPAVLRHQQWAGRLEHRIHGCSWSPPSEAPMDLYRLSDAPRSVKLTAVLFLLVLGYAYVFAFLMVKTWAGLSPGPGPGDLCAGEGNGHVGDAGTLGDYRGAPRPLHRAGDEAHGGYRSPDSGQSHPHHDLRHRRRARVAHHSRIGLAGVVSRY